MRCVRIGYAEKGPPVTVRRTIIIIIIIGLYINIYSTYSSAAGAN